MLTRTCLRRRSTVYSIFLILISLYAPISKANVWQSTFGQNWFYEVRGHMSAVIAGTWWESSLIPGTTYRISFEVASLNGAAGLWVGSREMISINRTGWHSYDFDVRSGGPRRMIFTAQSVETTLGARHINVAPAAATTATDNWIPKGHYLSFDTYRNLKATMMDLVEKPSTARSDWHLGKAREMHAALTTPGIQGFYMAINWGDFETGDGWFRWAALDDNMTVARKLGRKMIIKLADRSFDGTNILPQYFPSQYVLWTYADRNSGVVSKRWDPFVYTRLIRAYKAIATRYANDVAFGGIATTETATGYFAGSNGGYDPETYRKALVEIVRQTLPAMTRGRLFLYMNFLMGGESIDMNKDMRVRLLGEVPNRSLVVGGPDVTPDVAGMPRSVTAYRIHARKTRPQIQQFCHLQHVDHGHARINVKSNTHRQRYFDEVRKLRELEKQWWYKNPPAVIEFDDLRDPKGNRVSLHPSWVVGNLWNPRELFEYGRRNFNCQYVLWNWRDYPAPGTFSWPDVRPVVINNATM